VRVHVDDEEEDYEALYDEDGNEIDGTEVVTHSSCMYI